MLKFYPYIRSKANFKSIASGNLNDYSIYLIEGEDGVYYTSPYTPQKGNDLYIEAATTVTLTQNEACKDLHLNTTADVVRILNNGFRLDVWGKMRFYSGTAPGTSDITNDGVSGWIGNGVIRFRGSEDRTIMSGAEISANNDNIGWTFQLDFTNNAKALINTRARAEHWEIISGILEASQVRVGINEGAVDPNSDGNFICRNSATLLFDTVADSQQGVWNKPNLACALIQFDAGSILHVMRTGLIIAAVSMVFNGTIIIESDAALTLPTSNIAGGQLIWTVSQIEFRGTGEKTLSNSLVISSLLKRSGGAISLNSKTITYGTDGNLEYTASVTKGSELPALGTGTAIPKNIILADGVVLNLNGETVNIRETVTYGAGASITNGTLNENQP